MGSITALMYASKDPRINCLIFDSPFANFKRFVKELVKEKAPIPGFLVTGAFEIIRTTIKKKANFDIDALKPVKYVDKIAVPALFGAAKDDLFVSNQHTKDLFKAYGGHKQLMIFEGDHNSQRPPNWTKLVREFLRFHLLGEKHESQIPKKSIKNLFNAEKLQEPHPPASPLGIVHNLPHSHSTRPVSAAAQPPQQNHMTFSWLEKGASSPGLSGSQTSQSSINAEKANRYENKESHQSGKKIAEKRLNGMFSPQSPVQQGPKQGSVQYGFENNVVRSYDGKNSVSHTDRVQKKQDSPRLASRGYIDHMNAKYQEGMKSPGQGSKSISEIHSHANMFAFKENKTKNVSTVDGSLNSLDTPKVSISLKDASSHHLNNTLDHQLNSQKPKRKIFGPSNSQAKSPQSSTIPSVSVSLLNPKGSESNSQRDRSRKIFDKGAGAHTVSSHTVRTAGSKSFTNMVTLHDQRVLTDNSVLKEANKKGLHIDVHSNVHVVTPVHTVPNAQINYAVSGTNNVNARRISDNYSHVSHFEEFNRKDYELLIRNSGAR